MSVRVKILFLPIVLLCACSANKRIVHTGDIAATTTEFYKEISRKTRIYQNRLNRKTEKTLIRLSKWETKIQRILHRVDPETEQKLFADPKLTFGHLLSEYRKGFSTAEKTGQHYDTYLDRTETTIRYLEVQNGADGCLVSQAGMQLRDLQKQTDRSEYIKTFIQRRKKQLLAESVRHLGKSKALQQLNKESYYYTAALENYKAIFSDPGKREEAMKKSLSEIPAFQDFVRRNSQLASLFRIPGTGGSAADPAAVLAGLQTRAGVQSMIEDRIRAGGSNAAAQVRQNLSEAQAKLSSIKDKILKSGPIDNGEDTDMPNFKPNEQRSKTLWQRLAYGFDIQFAKNNSYLPSTTDFGVSLGYRLNDRSSIGAGLSYKLGLGSIDNIRMSSEGIGLRSYLDWKIKGQWYATGGYELNYMSAFKDIAELKSVAWQRSGLIGVSRQYKIGKKRNGEMKILYDLLHRRDLSGGIPVVVRMGYSFH